MRRIILILLMVMACRLLSGQGGTENVKATLSVYQLAFFKWDNPEGVTYRQVPGANLGAVSFTCMGKNKTAFLCNSTSEIVILGNRKGNSIARFPVTFAPRDFILDKNRFYVLSEFKMEIYDESGKNTGTVNFDRSITGVERMARYNDSSYLLLPSGNSLLFESGGRNIEPKEYEGWITGSGIRVKTAITGDNKFRITVFMKNGQRVEMSFSENKKIAGVYVAGASDRRIFIDLQTFLSENPVKVERKIISMKMNGKELQGGGAEIKVPDVYYVLSNKDVYATADGKLFQMISSPLGIFVFSLSETKHKKNRDYNYPLYLQRNSYHFNDHLMNAE